MGGLGRAWGQGILSDSPPGTHLSPQIRGSQHSSALLGTRLGVKGPIPAPVAASPQEHQHGTGMFGEVWTFALL